MSIGFNSIPGNIVAPIISFEVNSGGQFESQSRLVLLGHKNSDAALPLDTLTPVQTIQEAIALTGKGSMLAEMFRVARANAPAQEIWLGAAEDSGTAEVRTITVSAVPAAGGVGTIQIAGEILQVEIAAGDAVGDVAAALAAAINGYQNRLTLAALPFTATAALGVVTVTARHKGAITATVDISVPASLAGNAFTGNVAFAVTTPGVGAPDLSGLLAGYGDDAFDWTISPFADDANVGRYETLMNDVSGRWAWNRQSYGHVFTVKTDTLSGLTTFGLTKDTRHLSTIPQISAGENGTPPWLFLAGVVSRVVPWISDGATGNVSRNQTGLVVQQVLSPRKRSMWLNDYASRDALLTSGVSTFGVNANGDVTVDKIVTMQRTDGAGNVDTTFRDIQAIGQLMYALRRFRARLQAEHGQTAIADSNPGDLLAITTAQDIKATMVATAAAMPGVLENIQEFAQRLEVRRNGDNPNRVDVYAPLDLINPLDIFAANAVIYRQYPATSVAA
jgi:phage tail sheath gpL-like